MKKPLSVLQKEKARSLSIRVAVDEKSFLSSRPLVSLVPSSHWLNPTSGAAERTCLLDLDFWSLIRPLRHHVSKRRINFPDSLHVGLVGGANKRRYSDLRF